VDVLVYAMFIEKYFDESMLILTVERRRMAGD